MGPETRAPVAAIDIGSGAIKLLVTDGTTPLAVQAFKTKLIAGAGNNVSDDALEATATALDNFAEILEKHQPTRLAVVGTAVARTATNADVLQGLVKDRLGVPLEVLSGSREAELAFAGAMIDRDIEGVVSVMDIGAGSTEFASRSADGTMSAMSLPIGGGNLTDQYLASDPPQAAELSSALSIVELHLVDLRRERPAIAEAIEGGTVIAVGASSVIASVEVGSNDPDHRVDGYCLEKVGLEEVFRVLATESARDRRHNRGSNPSTSTTSSERCACSSSSCGSSPCPRSSSRSGDCCTGLRLNCWRKARLDRWLTVSWVAGSSFDRYDLKTSGSGRRSDAATPSG